MRSRIAQLLEVEVEKEEEKEEDRRNDWTDVSFLLEDGTLCKASSSILKVNNARISAQGVAEVEVAISESSVSYKQRFKIKFSALAIADKWVACTDSVGQHGRQ